ncbi:MAG TPA: trimeric intracellular cation channel family protein [Rhizobiaceae bacterium]|nr:trimeric intracellular cation channel family protein [Rhizobiaceae bacterium]
MNAFLLLDYAGVAVFAATGALAASRKQLDIIGFIFLAAVTGIGGGTFRDLILDVPVVWVANPDYLIVCAIVAVIVYFTAHLVESRYKLLLWLDALGLSAYAVLGAYKGLVVTGSAEVAVVMGVLTATFGGILRDLLANEPSVLLRPEVYVTAALAGAFVFTLLHIALGPDAWLVATILGFCTAFFVRAGALRFGWSFPPYRGRPGRRPEDIP